MAHKKVKLQRIVNDKTRITTYKKRKACLYKKAWEFSTLCGVQTCLIVYGPNKATDEVVSEPELWPKDETKVIDIIRKYKDTISNSCKKETHVETFVKGYGKPKEINNNKRVKKGNTNSMMKYCMWEEKLDKCSQEELHGIFCDVEHKLNEALMRQNHNNNMIVRAYHEGGIETRNMHISSMDQYYYMQQRFHEQQQQQQQEMLMLPNMGFSLLPSHDHDGQIQMDQNVMENNWTELGLGQGLMMSKGNNIDGQIMQMANEFNYNVDDENVLQRLQGINLNQGYYGGFNPWSL
ncbi:unnamed protein product [Cochlearia groenlandica]